MPLAPLTVLTSLLHIYLALRLTPALLPNSAAGVLLVLYLLASAACMPLPFTRRAAAASPLARRLQQFGLLAMGVFSTLLLLSVLRDALSLIGWALSALGLSAAAMISGEAWRSASAWAVIVLTALISVWGVLNARSTARVRRIDVPIDQLPQQLRGFTIAQLSDLHVGNTIGKSYIQRIVDRVNALNADMVAITGDLIDGPVSQLREHVAPLAQLRARHGTFVVTGNHEYYAGALPWVEELRRLGLQVLINEHVVLQTRNVQGAQTDEEVLESALVVAGVTDYTAGHFVAEHASDPQRALWDAPPLVRTRILLAHQPRSAPAAAAADFSLQLSGHTHGGQIFPWNFFVPLQQPFTAGLHRVQQMWIYISRGTGYWGPPLRVAAPSEIALITLTGAR